MSKALEAAARAVAKAHGDRGTFTVCWGETERGEPCRCKEEARAAILAFLREAGAEDIGCGLVGDFDERAAIANGEIAAKVIAALARLAEGE